MMMGLRRKAGRVGMSIKSTSKQSFLERSRLQARISYPNSPRKIVSACCFLLIYSLSLWCRKSSACNVIHLSIFWSPIHRYSPTGIDNVACLRYLCWFLVATLPFKAGMQYPKTHQTISSIIWYYK